jgi:hypothetical protein
VSNAPPQILILTMAEVFERSFVSTITVFHERCFIP